MTNNKYAIVGMPTYIAYENCGDFGFDPAIYGCEENNKIPSRKEVMAKANATAEKLGITIGGFDWATDETGWWYLGFREYVSYDISDCGAISEMYEPIGEEMNNDFKLATDGEPCITSRRNPKGRVVGKFVAKVEKDEDMEYYSWNLCRN